MCGKRREAAATLQWLVDTSHPIDLEGLSSSVAMVTHPDSFEDLKHASVAVKPATLSLQSNTPLFLFVCDGRTSHRCLGGFVVTQQNRRAKTLELTVRRALLTKTVECEKLKLPIPAHIHLSSATTVVSAYHMTSNATKKLVQSTFITVPAAAFPCTPTDNANNVVDGSRNQLGREAQHDQNSQSIVKPKHSIISLQLKRQLRVLWNHLLAAVQLVDGLTRRLGKFVYRLPPQLGQQRIPRLHRIGDEAERNYFDTVYQSMESLSRQWHDLDITNRPVAATSLAGAPRHLRAFMHAKYTQKLRRCFQHPTGDSSSTAVLIGDSRMFQMYTSILRMLTSDEELNDREADSFPGIGAGSVCGDILLKRSGWGQHYREERRFQGNQITIYFFFNSNGPWDVYVEQTLKSVSQLAPDLLFLSPCALELFLPQTTQKRAVHDMFQSYSHKLLQLATALQEFQKTRTRTFCCIWPTFPVEFRDFHPRPLQISSIPVAVMQSYLTKHVLGAYFDHVDPDAHQIQLICFDAVQSDSPIALQAYHPDFVHFKAAYIHKMLNQLLDHVQTDEELENHNSLPLVTPSSAPLPIVFLKNKSGGLEAVQVMEEDFLSPTESSYSPPSFPIPQSPPTNMSTPTVHVNHQLALASSETMRTTAVRRAINDSFKSPQFTTNDPFEARASPAPSDLGKDGVVVRALISGWKESFVRKEQMMLECEPVYRFVHVHAPSLVPSQTFQDQALHGAFPLEHSKADQHNSDLPANVSSRAWNVVRILTKNIGLLQQARIKLASDTKLFVDATVVGDLRLYQVLKLIFTNSALRVMLNNSEWCLDNICNMLGYICESQLNNSSYIRDRVRNALRRLTTELQITLDGAVVFPQDEIVIVLEESKQASKRFRSPVARTKRQKQRL